MAPPEPHPHRRPGSVLLVVLVVVALLTITTTAYFQWTFTELKATESFGRRLQARAAADSWVELIKTLLAYEQTVIDDEGGLYDNPTWFRGFLLSDSDAAALRLRVSAVAPVMDYGVYRGRRFGLENESSRLNLNTLLLADQHAEDGARLWLMALPGMTESIADAILDFIDEDDEPRPLGAESEHYATLETPYAPLNGPLESIDQLLLVRDVTPELLYGIDRDRNFVLDAAEAAAPTPGGVDNTDGVMDRGWAAYLTLYSAESTLTPEGEPKINVNGEDLEALHAQLVDALGLAEANFIVAYRQGGAEDGATTGEVLQPSAVQIDFTQPGSETIDSLLALVGTRTRIVNDATGGQRQVVETPFPESAGAMLGYLPDLMDKLTVADAASYPGRLNINQAPRRLLAAVPNLPIEAVEQIIGLREFDPGPERPDRRHATWLLTENVLTLDQMRAIEPLVTAGGDVFRAQVVATFDDEGTAHRVEVVIDRTGATPAVVHAVDLTPLGAGLTAADVGGAAGAGAVGVPGQAAGAGVRPGVTP